MCMKRHLDLEHLSVDLYCYLHWLYIRWKLMALLETTHHYDWQFEWVNMHNTTITESNPTHATALELEPAPFRFQFSFLPFLHFIPMGWKEAKYWQQHTLQAHTVTASQETVNKMRPKAFGEGCTEWPRTQGTRHTLHATPPITLHSEGESGSFGAFVTDRLTDRHRKHR